MNFSWSYELFLSAVASTGFCAAIARYFILRSLVELETVSRQVTCISQKLAVIEVKLSKFDKLEDMLGLHNQKIVDIESRFKYQRKQ